MTLRPAALALACVLVLACGTADPGEDMGMAVGGEDAGRCVDECSAGDTCEGDTVVSCATGPNGCLVETRTGCADGELCEAGACVADPCADIDNDCVNEVRGCEGDTLVICAENADGCLVETRTDCAEADMGFCDREAGICDGPFDACADLESACDAAGATCDGDTAVVCAADAFRCLAEERIDCAAEGLTCDGGRCVGDIDCSARDDRCFVTGNSCDGPVLVQCQRDAFGCLSESRVDCADLPDGAFGVCDPAFQRCRSVLMDPCPAEPECPGESVACEAVTELVTCSRDTFGCFVEDRVDCARSGDACAPESASCESSRCPPAPTVLDCASGTVRADTALGSDSFDDYACASGTAGPEAGWQLEVAEDARVTLTASPSVATVENFDLLVLDGEASGADCGEATPCLAQGSEEGAAETVTVDLRGGDLAFVFYDGVGATGTIEVDLTVTCETPVCGDGVIGAFEACDDGGDDDDDGCSATCALEPAFECAGEPSVCTPLCGNGRVDPLFETCDDGNEVDGDGCTACYSDLPTTITPLALAGTLAATDPLWDRATDVCGGRGPRDVAYDVFFVVNASAEDRTYAVVGEWTAPRAVHVFSDPFDPGLPTSGCLTGAVGDEGATLAIEVPAGERRVIVVSQDEDTSRLGAYDLTIAEAFGIAATATGETALRGNAAGGSRFDDACPAGQLPVGLDAEAPRGWLGQLALVCGTPQITSLDGIAYTVSVGGGTTLPPRGSGVGSAQSARCAADAVAVGFAGRSGALVDQLALRCAPLSVSGSPGSFTITSGAASTSPTVGGRGGTAFADTDCPSGEVGRGAVIRAGGSVDAFGMLCGTVAVP